MHKHEWDFGGWEWECYCVNNPCRENLSALEIERRLNATEELSAEDAKALTMPALLNEEKFQAGIDALRAYAERMEA